MILDAFAPYYNKAELENVSDVNVVYDLQKTLDQEQIYHWEEVREFALAFFDLKAASSKLSYYCHPAKERFAIRYKAALEDIRVWRESLRAAERNGDKAGGKRAEQELKEAGERKDALDLFRKNLQSFVRAYEFLSQIVHYDDADLEQLCVYAKHLHPLLRVDRLDEEQVDVTELQLTHYRLTKRAEHQLRLEKEDGEYGLKPLSEVGSGKPHDPEKKRLSEIIEKLNDLFGLEVTEQDKLHFANGIADRISRDEAVMEQVRSHSAEQVMHGLFPKRVTDAVLDSLGDYEKLSTPILESLEAQREFALVILRIVEGTLGARGVQENARW